MITELFWKALKYLLIALWAFAIFGAIIFGTGWGIE